MDESNRLCPHCEVVLESDQPHAYTCPRHPFFLETLAFWRLEDAFDRTLERGERVTSASYSDDPAPRSVKDRVASFLESSPSEES